MRLEPIQRLKDEGGEVLFGGERLTVPGGCYMKPCLAIAKPDFEIVKHETYGPLLYLLTYRDLDEAMAIHNNVPQGLTSSIFTNDVREAEKFVSAVGSDCWKSYMRRQTNTVNFSSELPLAQGIQFGAGEGSGTV